MCAQLCRTHANESSVDWKVNIYSRLIKSICQGQSMPLQNHILIPEVVFLNWIPVVEMAKFALFTKTALQVCWLL